MKINKLLFPLFTVTAVLLVYRIIFIAFPISGGDYTRITSAQLFTWKYFSFNLWSTNINLGWGIIPLLSYAPYSLLMGWLGGLVGNSGIIVERLFWWIPFLIVGFISSLLLSKKLFRNGIFSYLAPLIYLANTYILLIIGGGQIGGIGQAYSFAPLLIFSYIRLMEKPTFSRALLTGLALTISIMFDLRMTYVLLVGIGIYLFIKIISQLALADYEFKNVLKNVGLVLVVPGVIAALLQSYWLIPMAIVRQNPLAQLGSAYDTTSAVKFFSFANFENAFGLLHPNWPENIFGKVGFMKPEFLLLPIFAYGSLLFINRKQETENKKQKNENLYVIYFALLGLVGTFLAKGANDPFGGIYLWMFGHIPGFIMFRDPTKWYLLIAISYSMLIPYTVGKIYELLKRRFA